MSWASIASSGNQSYRKLHQSRQSHVPNIKDLPPKLQILVCDGYSQLRGISNYELRRSMNGIVMVTRNPDLTPDDFLKLLRFTSEILDYVPKDFYTKEFIIECYKIIGLELNYKQKIPISLYKNPIFMKSLYRMTHKYNDFKYLSEQNKLNDDDIAFILTNSEQLRNDIKFQYAISQFYEQEKIKPYIEIIQNIESKN
jgi:hypothetical protein